MRTFIFICILTFLSSGMYAQNFINGDLDGVFVGIIWASLPHSWQSVPFTDPACQAHHAGAATPDLTDSTRPSVFAGVMGNPFSGDTYVGGGFAPFSPTTALHEGIMQTVSGFTPGCTYKIRFYQTVDRALSYLDTAGAWSVYIDNTLAGTSALSISHNMHDDPNHNWELREVSFTATAPTHTIKFLPFDDEAHTNVISQESGWLRVAIDSISIVNELQFDLGRDTILCNGQSIILDPGITNGSFLWQDNSINSTYTVTQSGIYWVQVNSSCGSYIDTIEINYNNNDTLSLGADTTLCKGESLILSVSNKNASYQWQDNSTDSTYLVDQPGTYWVKATLSCGELFDSITITYTDNTFDLGNDTIICSGDSLILKPDLPAGAYQWQDSSTNSTYIVSEPGSYWLSVQNTCGTFTDSILISEENNTAVDLGEDTAICSGDNLLLFAGFGFDNYQWHDNSTDSIYEVVQEGVYWVQVQNFCGLFTDTIHITTKPFPEVTLGADTTLCSGDTITLLANVNDNGTIIWNDNSMNSSLEVNKSGLYSVNFTNECGTVSDDIIVQVDDCNCNVFLPNAFSPNGDGINDEFGFRSNCEILDFNMQIFNRWGELIFESSNSNTWDGLHNGRPVETGVYICRVTYQAANINELKVIDRNVTVLR